MATAPAPAEPSTAPSSTAPVAVPTSPVSPPQHPVDGLCFTPLLGTQDPSSRGNQPPELLATAVPSGMASSVFPAFLLSLLLSFLFCPSLSLLSLFPSPLPTSGCSGQRQEPPRYPVPCPPRPCCCRTRLFAPHHPPSAVCGVPCAPLQHHCYSYPQHTPAATQAPSPAPAMPCMAQGATQHPPTLQCTVQLGVRCNPPPPLPKQYPAWPGVQRNSPA